MVPCGTVSLIDFVKARTLSKAKRSTTRKVYVPGSCIAFRSLIVESTVDCVRQAARRKYVNTLSVIKPTQDDMKAGTQQATDDLESNTRVAS